MGYSNLLWLIIKIVMHVVVIKFVIRVVVLLLGIIMGQIQCFLKQGLFCRGLELMRKGIIVFHIRGGCPDSHSFLWEVYIIRQRQQLVGEVEDGGLFLCVFKIVYFFIFYIF